MCTKSEGEESCVARRVKCAARSAAVEQGWGVGTAVTAWGRKIEVMAPRRAISYSSLLRRPCTVSEEAKERFP